MPINLESRVAADIDIKRTRIMSAKPQGANAKRGANYRTTEGKALCDAWLSVSCDPCVGVNQTGKNFYARIKALFDSELKSLGAFVTDRTSSSLASRFQTISHSVSKFVGCHSKVVAMEASGKSPTDLEHDALALFESTCSSGRFRFMQCWYILRGSPKWSAWLNANEKRFAPKKRKPSTQVESDQEPGVDVESYDDTDATTDECAQVQSDREERPQGTKRAKTEARNLALYERQVRAAETMAESAKARNIIAERQSAIAEKQNAIAEKQTEQNVFIGAPPTNDPDVLTYLRLERKRVLNRLESTETTQPTSVQGTAIQVDRDATAQSATLLDEINDEALV